MADGPENRAASGGATPRPLRTLDEVLGESALLHARRANVFRSDLGSGWTIGPLLRRFSAAQASHRMRFAALLLRRTARALREDGPVGTLRLVARRILPGGRPPAPPTAAPAQTDPYLAPIGEPAASRLATRVLVVAELSIPQCAKYRVWQKVEGFARLGVPCTVVDWRESQQARSALQVHTSLIMYRIPGSPENLALVAEARRLGVEARWEVDDLVFDVDLYSRNANLQTLPASLRRNLLRGAALYRRAMLEADGTIASTPVLAELMSAASGRPSVVVPNALDAETLAHAESALAERASRDPSRVVIVYGSGTKTHDADMAVAAPALLRLLADDPRVHLLIVGELTLEPGFAAFADRVARAPFTNFRNYLATLASADISIAPLEDTIFNDAKSNIKLLEAAMLRLPSVCSPAREFRGAVEHGVDGFLARDTDEWYAALRALVDDPARRTAMGNAAHARLRASYDPGRVAATHLPALLADAPPLRRARLRVLVVNVFFAPRSFGGATIVAEEMAHRLDARPDTEVFVFTTHAIPGTIDYELRRYRTGGLDVIASSTPGYGDHILAFDDPQLGARFADLLAAVAPDVVHFHAMQSMGTALLRACQVRGVPYVVTLHDAWWLCQRQFMVQEDNTYCFQRTIDLKICERCIPDAKHLGERMDIMLQALHGAALLLSPSASHASLYAANGLPADRLRVNRNGVRMPAAPVTRRQGGPIRFGYVGGNAALKGTQVIRQAFRMLRRRDWSLVLVDNMLELGRRSLSPREWALGGEVEIVAPYGPDGIDAFFADLDVLLFPSQWKESYGLTVREALARDVWVIATDSGGAAEEIVPGVNGTVIPLGNDPAPLAAAIADAIAQRDALRAHVNPFKSTLATMEAQADELHRFLSEVAGTRAAS